MKSTSIFLVLAFLLVATGCSTFWGEVNAVIEPADDTGQSAVRCNSSSSGTCFLLLGAVGSADLQTYSVPVGSSLLVAMPADPTPYCVSYSESSVCASSNGVTRLISRSGTTIRFVQTP